jgi:hypothetical protein
MALVRAVLGHFEQRGFPDTGFAADDKRRSALVDPIEQMVDEGNVLVSTLQSWRCRSGGARALSVPFRPGISCAFAHPTTGAGALLKQCRTSLGWRI